MINYRPKTWRVGPAFFIFASVLYFIGSNYFDASVLARLSAVSITLGLILGLVFGDSRSLSTISKPLIVMTLFAGFNILVSVDQIESALRWAIWLEMLIAMGILATHHDDALDYSIASLVPWGMAIIWWSKYIYAIDDTGLVDVAGTLHLSAFFASLTISTGLFHPSKLLRLLFCIVGVYGVLVSGSRAAILFLPLQFIFGFLYFNRNKLAAVATLLLPLLILVSVILFEPLREATFGKKAALIGRDAFDDAASSLEDRGYLRDLAYDFMWEKPLGYGYGNTYTIPGAKKDRGNNFHNGFLNVGVPMGAHFMLVYLVFLAWIVKSLLFERVASRLFRYLFLAILLSGGLRALTEDFTLFDLGNPVSYLIVYLVFIYLNRRQNNFIRAD